MLHFCIVSSKANWVGVAFVNQAALDLLRGVKSEHLVESYVFLLKQPTKHWLSCVISQFEVW